ncbi:MAG: hypothetical protein H6R19_3613 [Proteobacteria bacterium]|nr:hypothetical protein [Pseudomonadota bacterium]
MGLQFNLHTHLHCHRLLRAVANFKSGSQAFALPERAAIRSSDTTLMRGNGTDGFMVGSPWPSVGIGIGH